MVIFLNTNDVYTEEAILRQQKKGGSIVERLRKNSERTEKITETIFHKCGESKITFCFKFISGISKRANY